MKISVLLPTRGRVEPLIKAIRSLLDNFSNHNSIEILLRFDLDDLNTVETVKTLIAYDNRVQFFVGQPHGYRGAYIYINELSACARGEWLLLFNDDAIMETRDWDKEIEKHNGKIVFLDTTIRKLWFPIIPRQVFLVLGHFSLATQCDSWICDIGEMLKIIVPTSISILHDRADLTGNNNDVTYKNSQSQYQTDYRNPRDEELRKNDALRLKEYIDGLQDRETKL
jgi:glycosyltransferase involved in cell wall biosynthesis